MLFDLTCGYKTTPKQSACSEKSFENGFCKEHSKHKCSCGAKAEYGCRYTGRLECGLPVCSKCGWCMRHRRGHKVKIADWQ